MTRTQHHAHATPSFPVYCLAWAADDALVLGGGGGPSRSGIDNKLKLANVSPDGRQLTYINELTLSRDEDAPMTLAVDRAGKRLVTGINAARVALEQGENAQCRVYTYEADQLAFARAAQTIAADWAGNFDDYPYQKLTALAPDAALVAVGTTDNAVALLSLPALARVPAAFDVDGELVDLSFSGPHGGWLAVATTSKVVIYTVAVDGEKVDVKLAHTVVPPDTSLAFRSARLVGAADGPALVAVLNSARRGRGAPTKSYVAHFARGPGGTASGETALRGKTEGQGEGEGKAEGNGGPWRLVAKREVGNKPVTVCDVSEDGRLVAYGCSDLSLGILDAQTLAPLLKILHAHSFPPTALKFNPAASLLVSASADNTVRVVVVPSAFGAWSPALLALVIALLAVLAAVLLGR
ncbi:hypothetical protein Q5752_004679 [Cryptotrichosporon argae]